MITAKHPVVISIAFAGLWPLQVLCQESTHQSAIEETHERYEEAISSQDYEGLAAMFTDDALYLPLTGGALRGPEQIQQHFEQMRLVSMEVDSVAVRDIGDNMVVDTGTFSLTLPAAAGGTSMKGEYVAVAEVTEEGITIHSLSGFPMRPESLVPD